MATDRLFADPAAGATEFQFDARVAGVFNDMLARSIPFYAEQQQMVAELARKLYQRGTRVYDLGCSLGTTLMGIGEAIGPDARELIGYDLSLPMVEKCRGEVTRRGLSDRIRIEQADLNDCPPVENASIVTMLWTLQFVRPLRRDELIRRICQGLVENGALIIAEKILTDSSHMNRFFIEMYYDYKRRHGYSDDEIARKREALENVLVPYRSDENTEMLKHNGFAICEPFFQYYNFAGYLCIKQAG